MILELINRPGRLSLATLCLSVCLAHIGEYEPPEIDVLVDQHLQVGHRIGRRPVQEDVESDGRALVLDLVDQRGETDGVVDLESCRYLALCISYPYPDEPQEASTHLEGNFHLEIDKGLHFNR